MIMMRGNTFMMPVKTKKALKLWSPIFTSFIN